MLQVGILQLVFPAGCRSPASPLSVIIRQRVLPLGNKDNVFFKQNKNISQKICKINFRWIIGGLGFYIVTLFFVYRLTDSIPF